MFGVPYDSLELASLIEYKSEIPVVLTVLQSYLEYNHGFEIEGIFRKNNEKTFLNAMSKMDIGYSLNNIDGVNNHIVAQLIKAFFREYEIASPGFFTNELLDCLTNNDDNEIILQFNKINEPLKSIIVWLIDLIIYTSNFKQENKMTISNLSICFHQILFVIIRQNNCYYYKENHNHYLINYVNFDKINNCCLKKIMIIIIIIIIIINIKHHYLQGFMVHFIIKYQKKE